MARRAAAESGAPAEELAPLQNTAMPVRSLVDPVFPDVLLEDGAKPEVPGWDPDRHLDPGPLARPPLLLRVAAPAHALRRPRAPAHHAEHPVPPSGRSEPPRGLFASLDKLEPYDVEEVLPAHEYRFPDLQTRLEELRQHHRDRFAEVVAILREGPHSAWDIASQDEVVAVLGRHRRLHARAAVGETVSHLRRARDRRRRPGRRRRAHALVPTEQDGA